MRKWRKKFNLITHTESDDFFRDFETFLNNSRISIRNYLSLNKKLDALEYTGIFTSVKEVKFFQERISPDHYSSYDLKQCISDFSADSISVEEVNLDSPLRPAIASVTSRKIPKFQKLFKSKTNETEKNKPRFSMKIPEKIKDKQKRFSQTRDMGEFRDEVYKASAHLASEQSIETKPKLQVKLNAHPFKQRRSPQTTTKIPHSPSKFSPTMKHSPKLLFEDDRRSSEGISIARIDLIKRDYENKETVVKNDKVMNKEDFALKVSDMKQDLLESKRSMHNELDLPNKTFSNQDYIKFPLKSPINNKGSNYFEENKNSYQNDIFPTKHSHYINNFDKNQVSITDSIELVFSTGKQLQHAHPELKIEVPFHYNKDSDHSSELHIDMAPRNLKSQHKISSNVSPLFRLTQLKRNRSVENLDQILWKIKTDFGWMSPLHLKSSQDSPSRVKGNDNPFSSSPSTHKTRGQNEIKLFKDYFLKEINEEMDEEIEKIDQGRDRIEKEFDCGFFSDNCTGKSNELIDKNIEKIGIKDFEFIRLINKGAFGRVWLVKRRFTGDIYAMKIINLQDDMNRNKEKSLKAESQIFDFITGDYVVRAIFKFTHENFLCFVMDYMDGGDFSYILDSYGPLEVLIVQFI